MLVGTKAWAKQLTSQERKRKDKGRQKEEKIH